MIWGKKFFRVLRFYHIVLQIYDIGCLHQGMKVLKYQGRQMNTHKQAHPVFL
jgi:hypothetical protein